MSRRFSSACSLTRIAHCISYVSESSLLLHFSHAGQQARKRRKFCSVFSQRCTVGSENLTTTDSRRKFQLSLKGCKTVSSVWTFRVVHIRLRKKDFRTRIAASLSGSCACLPSSNTPFSPFPDAAFLLSTDGYN